MPITTQRTSDGDAVRIRIAGRFDFPTHREFRDAYQRFAADGRHYVVDLSATDHLDSSALGMLLKLRDFALARAGSVRIEGATGTVASVLDVVDFDRYFAIG